MSDYDNCPPAAEGDLRARIEAAFATDGFVPEPVLSDAHAQYHDQPGNLIGKDECGWDCHFWEGASYMRDHLRAALAQPNGDSA